MKNKILVFLTLIVLFATTSVFAVAFTDLTEEHWAFNYIADLTEKKVVNGYPDGTFLPEGTISRGEFLKLVIAASMPKDVPIALAPKAIEHWAGQYLHVAITYGVVSPNDITLENIDLPITRREMTAMITKADLNMRGISKNTEKSLTFTDFSEFNTYERELLTHAISQEYLNGYPDGSFGPNNEMTRAEAATVIYRFTNIQK